MIGFLHSWEKFQINKDFIKYDYHVLTIIPHTCKIFPEQNNHVKHP
jgi:hypothetical protein